jgi:ferredoxin
MVRVRLRAAYACTMLCGASGFPAVPTAPAVSRSARVLSLAAGHSPAEGEGKGPHTIYFKGEEIVAEHGETLRSALLQGKVTPHNGRAQLINCRGLGTCGTCAVQLEGQVYPESWNARERLRLNFPPHKPPNNERLRLACQVNFNLQVVQCQCIACWCDAAPIT